MEYASSYIYQPIEKVFCQNVKDYRKLGVDGPMMTTQPPDGIYQKKWDGHICKEIWYGNWQTFYLGARFLWDDSRNYEKEYEEANSLYYGKAWEGGMKEFRRLLTKYATETPGCAGYGHDNVIGRCLDQPGSKEKLLAALEKAEKAASTPREKLHVARDRKFFSIFWLDARDRYVESYRELRSFDHDKPIVIDGKCDEEDWKKADIVSNFKVFAATEPTVKGKKLSPAKHQTYVRTTYDAAHLYFYLEMMEPSTDKMIARKTKKDEKLWHDNSVELFVWHPDLGESYYHLILNHKGVLYDAKKNPGSRAEDRSWESGLEYRINILKDRWVVECKLPTRNLGMIARHGYVWKINVGRSRFVAGEKAPAHIKRDSIPWELSSISSGNFHNIANFLPFNMLGKRQLISMRGEGNTAPFSNGNFNKKRKLNKTVIANMAKKGHFAVNNIMPSGWLFNGKNGKLELCSHKENENDCYVKLFNGILYQLHYGDAKNVKIRFRAKSDDGGKLKLNLYRYRMENRKSRKNLPTKTAISALPLEKNWKEYTVTLNTRQIERQYCVTASA